MDDQTPRSLPDYDGGSIVNLMTSIVLAFDGEPPSPHPPLRTLPPERLDTRNVVLLVIDGLGFGKLTATVPDGALMRHRIGHITSVFPTTTATAVTTFLTGVAPQQHGVTGWFTHFRELGGVLAVLPYRPRHGGSAPALPPAVLLGHVPVFDRLAAHSHVVVPRNIAHSDYNMAHNGRAAIHPFDGLEQMFAAVTAAVRGRGGRRYVYAYWADLDRLAHAHGIESARATSHLARIDTAFDRFLGEIGGTDTTVIVCADHGFIDASPAQAIELDDHPELGRLLSLPLCGERRVAYCYVQARHAERFVGYATERLAPHAELMSGEQTIESGWFGRGAAHPRLGERVGDYVLLPRDRAVIKDWLPGERRHTQIGVHGGLSPDELLVPLVVARA